MIYFVKCLLPFLAVAAMAACSEKPEPAPPTVDPVVDPTPAVDPPKEEGNTVCTDAPLLVETASTPVLGTAGYIRVYTAKDSKLVDEINLGDLSSVTVREDGQTIPSAQMTKETVMHTFMDAIKSGSRYRIVHYTPVRATDKGLEIRLHNSVLSFDTEYKVTVDAGVIEGGEAKEWAFKTRKKPAATAELQVKPDGTGDFCTIQGALSYASTLGKATAVTVHVAEGTYREMLFLRDKDNVTLKGAGRRDNCVISYANNESYAGGSGGSQGSKPSVGRAIGTCGGRGVILVESCDNLTLENLTVQNTFGEEKGQAETIYFNSNGHLTLENCALHSLQDTFLCKGLVYVHNSLIVGHCDFIWGYPKACLFEKCEIRAAAPGYIVQARVSSSSDKGFVFLDCDLTAASGVRDGSMYLARSGGSGDYYDNVTFIRCKMGSVIASEGWYTKPAPNPSVPTASSGWKEYGSMDASGNPVSGHHSYGKVLSASEAEAFSSKEVVLGK